MARKNGNRNSRVMKTDSPKAEESEKQEAPEEVVLTERERALQDVARSFCQVFASSDCQDCDSPDGTSSKDGSPSCCGACEEAAGEFICLQCDFPLCADCRATTHSKGKFLQHEILPVAVALRRKADRRECPAHAGQTLDLYCADCDCCVCVTCCFGGAHKGHHVSPLEEVVVARKESLRASVAAHLATLGGECSAVQDAVRVALPQYDAHVDTVRDKIRRTFDQLREELGKRESVLLETLEERTAALRDDADSCSHLAQTLTTCLQESKEAVDTFTDTADNVTLVERFAKVRDVFEVLSGDAQHAVAASQTAADHLTTLLCTKEESLASFHLLTPFESDATALSQYSKVFADMGTLFARDNLQPNEPETNNSEVEAEEFGEQQQRQCSRNTEKEEEQSGDACHGTNADSLGTLSGQHRGSSFANRPTVMSGADIAQRGRSPPLTSGEVTLRPTRGSALSGGTASRHSRAPSTSAPAPVQRLSIARDTVTGLGGCLSQRDANVVESTSSLKLSSQPRPATSTTAVSALDSPDGNLSTTSLADRATVGKKLSGRLTGLDYLGAFSNSTLSRDSLSENTLGANKLTLLPSVAADSLIGQKRPLRSREAETSGSLEPEHKQARLVKLGGGGTTSSGALSNPFGLQPLTLPSMSVGTLNVGASDSVVLPALSSSLLTGSSNSSIRGKSVGNNGTSTSTLQLRL